MKHKGFLNHAFSGCALRAALALLAVPLYAQSDIVFLGTDPTSVSNVPQSITTSGDFGFDLDRNYYFVDTAKQKVVRRSPSGEEAVIASGLSGASLATNWNGDLVIADAGNHRLIFQKHNPPLQRDLFLPPSQTPQRIVYGKNGEIFYLSGDSIYSVNPPIISSHPVASIPGALALAAGPETPNGHTLYILSARNGIYKTSIYTYQGVGGSLAASQDIGSLTGTFTSFRVDPQGNYILQTISNSATILQLITPNRSTYRIATTNDGSSGLSFDRMNRLDFIDGQEIKEVQFGPIDVGSYVLDIVHPVRGGPTLRYAAPPGSTAFSNFSAAVNGDFLLFSPTGDESQEHPCETVIAPQTCDLFLALYDYGNLGVRSGAVVSDLGKLPIHATAIFYLLSPIAANAPSTDFPSLPNLQHPSYVAAIDGSGYVIDPLSGVLAKVEEQGSSITQIATGLNHANGLAVDGNHNLYVIRNNIPGVVKIAPDGTKTLLAQNIFNPVAVTADTFGNIYLGNKDDVIYKIWAEDNAISLYSAQSKKLFMQSLVSLTADQNSNVYAAFSQGGPTGNGAIIKISQTGHIDPIPADFIQVASLAVDMGGDLYFTDAIRKSLNLITTSGTQLQLLSGLKDPKGVASFAEGLWALADPGEGVLRTPANPSWDYDFGNVAIGATKSATRYVLNTGNYPAFFYMEALYENNAFHYDSTLEAGAGNLGMLHFSFTPLLPGTTSIDLYADDPTGRGDVPSLVLSGIGVLPSTKNKTSAK